MHNFITIPSRHPFAKTFQKVKDLIAEKGFKIFSDIDHAGQAKDCHLRLSPTRLLIFGNPEIGTYLMQDQQTCGIDLPVKILVWADADGRVFLSYNMMDSMAEKHHLSAKSNDILTRIENTISDICRSSAGE